MPFNRIKPGSWRRWAALGIALLLTGAAPLACAAKATERSLQKQAAESERAAVRQKLTSLRREINQTETAKGHAADALSQSEAAISDANRALRDLAEEQRQTAARLAGLRKALEELTRVVDARQATLAKVLREHYVAGNEDRLKLLLSGDDPNRINRDLQYMGYVSQAQAKMIESLRADLQAVEKNKAETQNAHDELDEIAQEQRAQRALLEQGKAQRTILLTQLSTRLAAQRSEAGNIQRDEQRLSGLVDKLAKLIEEQRKAEIAQENRRRQQQAAQARAQAAQAKAERQKRQALQAQRAQKGHARAPDNPDAIDADENPEKVAARNEPPPRPAVQSSVFPDSFSALRGQLRLPVRGELIARFGGKRGDGPGWKGLFIRAAEGAEVKAVAAGRVVFAEWLRGFGNLIIVDHGSQYMSIYGNNQSILKRAGDAVKTGEVIASAGNSGGNEQSGLYFEMRHQGRAFDPLGWVTTR